MKIPSKTYSPTSGLQTFKYAHLKRDGHYLNIIRQSARPMLHAFTSAPKNIIADLQFHTKLIDLWQAMPMGTSICGELYLPGKQASAIKTAIIAENTDLCFEAFAVLGYAGYRPQQIERWTLEFTERIVKEMGIDFIPYLTSNGFEDPIQLMLSTVNKPIDCEGYMLKNSNLLDWHKLKWKRTIDLVITGVTAGEGKYSDTLGALVCSTSEGYEVANVSGMSDTIRRGMSTNVEQLIGKVVEVEFQYVGAQGRLRHPVFLHLREDKNILQCSINQDPELALCWKRLTAQNELF